MADELRANDPKAIWQNQSAGISAVNVGIIREKERQLRVKTRRQLLGKLTVPVVIVLLYAFAVQQFRSFQEVLHPLLAFSLVWSLAGVYFMNRGKWSEVIPGTSGFSPGINAYRAEIERRRDYLRGALVWFLGPLVLAIGTFVVTMLKVAGPKSFRNAISFIVLFVGWLIAFLVVQTREQRGLQRELDELRNIEQENRRL